MKKEEENAMSRIAELEKALENVKSILYRIGCRAAVCADECECGPDATSFRIIAEEAAKAAERCKNAVRGCKNSVRKGMKMSEPKIYTCNCKTPLYQAAPEMRDVLSHYLVLLEQANQGDNIAECKLFEDMVLIEQVLKNVRSEA